MVGGVGGAARANRPSLRPLGSQEPGQTLLGRFAREGRTQERLATRRGHRGARPAGGATPPKLRQVGRGGGPRRPEGVRGGASQRRTDGRTHRGRDRFPQERREERRRGAPVHGDGWGHGQLPGVGVFLTYSSEKGAAFLDRSLYLPRAWTNDPARRAEAGIPAELLFANKIELAEEMLERAFEADVPARWVVAVSFYGRSHAFRKWLEERGRPYAVMVPKTNAVPLGGRKKKIERYIERLGEEAFSEIRPAQDTGGRRPWEWACMDLAPDPKRDMRRWLLVRRSPDDPEEMGFYQAYGPEGTSVEELVRVCQDRWAVQECFAEAKGEVGLDHYEVRRWDACHRHVTLCLLAHALLVVARLEVRSEEDAARGAKTGISTPI